jgi:hypothetical protein
MFGSLFSIEWFVRVRGSFSEAVVNGVNPSRALLRDVGVHRHSLGVPTSTGLSHGLEV